MAKQKEKPHHKPKIDWLKKKLRQQGFIKFTLDSGTPIYGRFNPTNTIPFKLPVNRSKGGPWHEPTMGQLIVCQNGYHVCKHGRELSHNGPRAFFVEVAGIGDSDTHGRDDKSAHRNVRFHFELILDQKLVLSILRRHIDDFPRLAREVIKKELGLRKTSIVPPKSFEEGHDTYDFFEGAKYRKQDWSNLAHMCMNAKWSEQLFSKIVWAHARKQAPHFVKAR